MRYSVRELAHPSTKSAISHTWTSDTRDDLWTGTSGRLLKLTNVSFLFTAIRKTRLGRSTSDVDVLGVGHSFSTGPRRDFADADGTGGTGIVRRGLLA